MKKLLLLLLLIPNLVIGVSSSPKNLYEYKILRVIDGDTIEIEAKFLPSPLKPKLKLRIIGVDTPEKNSKKECEKILAERATLFTTKKIDEGKSKKIQVIKWDSFGRILGDVFIDGKSLKKLLLDGKLGRLWKRGKKISWC